MEPDGQSGELSSFADEACPECGGVVAHSSGCATCVSCGFSRCAD